MIDTCAYCYQTREVTVIRVPVFGGSPVDRAVCEPCARRYLRPVRPLEEPPR